MTSTDVVPDVTATTVAALVDAWRAEVGPATFPYQQVQLCYLQTGKHHVSSDLLSALSRARTRHAGWTVLDSSASRLLSAFLDVSLDKADGLYDYRSYIGLPLLPPTPADDLEQARIHRDRWLCWLMSDLLDFERSVEHGSRPLPAMRPTSSVIDKRLHLGQRAMRPALGRLGLDLTSNDPQIDQVIEFLAPMQTDETRLRIALSLLPVHTVHDEYLFIRVLQMFELTFAQLSLDLASAVTAIAISDLDTAETCFGSATRMLAESSLLFSLLATMQVEAFQTFRDFTEGASAIQSRSYKLMESLCRQPDSDRLDSAAYRSVPEIREAVLAGRLTVDEAYHMQCIAGSLEESERVRVREAASRFGAEMLRWRRTHYSLAIRMLGRERSGTGYTEGTPYLAAVRTVPIFCEVTATKESEPVLPGGLDV